MDLRRQALPAAAAGPAPHGRGCLGWDEPSQTEEVLNRRFTAEYHPGGAESGWHSVPVALCGFCCPAIEPRIGQTATGASEA